MHLIYSITWWLALPLVLLRLFIRGGKEPGYRRHVAERLGFYGEVRLVHELPVLWVHAVSVGETRAAQPLVEALLAAYPHHVVLLTHMTPTGRATGRLLFNKEPRVVQSYLPYDTSWMVGRFLRRFKPLLCVLMETEVWPNVMRQCRRHQVSVALVNARLSEKSLKKALRLPSLFVEAARAMTVVAMQSDSDAARVRQLCASNVHVTGSIKFDIVPPLAMLERGAALRARFGRRPVLVCANTRDGEESLILDALPTLNVEDVLLIIVPRHSQRFNDVAQQICSRGFSLARRSESGDAVIGREIQVMLGDSMGEMFAYYAAADLACVCGSLLPLGGHNLIEACAVGKPVLVGPYTFNFAEVAEDAISAGAALRVEDAKHMMQQATTILRDAPLRMEMGAKALVFARQHGGATSRTMALLRPLMEGRE